ncbi:MAG: winged helix-turn-helix domain-containing protein [Dehalococcoidales bacterium]|nr:winged helix-turn-helix domain-containing protein [Dehalococcoidales bacterium]
MDRNEVSTAFEIVMEEVESLVDSFNNEGAEAFRKGDYDAAKKLIEDATRLTAFRGKVRDLQKEWEILFIGKIPAKTKRRKYTYRLEKGLRTPTDAFRRPILETLLESGGSAPVSTVLVIVGEKMKNILNDYDRQPLPSQPNITRWNNNAQWCRYTLVQEGLLKSTSATGIWEISEKGRTSLRNREI